MGGQGWGGAGVGVLVSIHGRFWMWVSKYFNMKEILKKQIYK